jgi:tetratricopeptide (TPR) repeat protein
MFDDVPVRVWLLLLIAIVAIAPGRYVYWHIAHAPARRDITKPRDDLSWRTSRKLLLSLIALAGLVALGFLIFTPAAERLATSPNFWPILVVGFGAFALFSVARGFVTGSVEPLLKGAWRSYERKGQPKRYWASMAWNTVLGVLMIGTAIASREDFAEDSNWDRCFSGEAPQARSACNTLIANYSAVLKDDPDDFASHLNRARTYHQIGDASKAVEDYGAAIRLEPDDPEAYFNRGRIYLESRKFREAIADFGRAHELKPDNPWALANRGIAYALIQDEVRAQEDFKAARALDPSNPVVFRGEALLRMQVADWEGTVDVLSKSLKRDPDNAWALRLRAWTYGQLGEQAKAQEDIHRLQELDKQAEQQSPPG